LLSNAEKKGRESDFVLFYASQLSVYEQVSMLKKGKLASVGTGQEVSEYVGFYFEEIEWVLDWQLHGKAK